jgi:hypothetical protein
MITRLVAFALLMLSFSSFSADVERLEKLFSKNYNSFYTPRFCGRNIEKFVKVANEKGIDLSGSYVAKIVGGGFLETSAFYSRSNPNDRVMIGYFHMVLVADGYVFDFDLGEPVVLKLQDYVRLQFTPPYEPFRIYGIDYSAKNNPGSWNVTAFDTNKYGRGLESKLWSKMIKNLINMTRMISTDRSSVLNNSY